MPHDPDKPTAPPPGPSDRAGRDVGRRVARLEGQDPSQPLFTPDSEPDPSAPAPDVTPGPPAVDTEAETAPPAGPWPVLGPNRSRPSDVRSTRPASPAGPAGDGPGGQGRQPPRGSRVNRTSWTDLKDRVKQQTDLVQLVGQSVRLERRGRMFLGLCPWHNDGRPSLQVQPERQTWKCWVCNIGGDCFSFMMKREGVDFPEALTLLAEKAGLKADPALAGASFTRDEAGGTARRDLYRLNQWALEFYRAQLVTAEAAAPARQYAASRHFTAETLAAFAVGYAPRDWSTMSDRATAAGFPGDPG